MRKKHQIIIRSFLFFNVAKRLAQNFFVPRPVRCLLSCKHLQGNDEDMNPPATLHGSVNIFLLFAHWKREAFERVHILIKVISFIMEYR